MKTAYGRQVEHLMRNQINHITKIEFLPCFKAAFDASITESNIKGSFRGAGLVPFNPEAVLSKLEVRLRTPTPPTTEDTLWESRTPSNAIEFGSQSALVRSRIQRHLDSSPTSMIESLDRLTKGAELMIHSGVLMREEISSLRAANEAASRRRSYKRKRIQKNRILKIGEGAQLIALKGLSVELDYKNSRTKGCVNRSDPL